MFATVRRRAGRRFARWTQAEINQLGKKPDSVLARRFGRTIKAIASMREQRRLLFRIPSLRWTAREIRMLGKWSDCELARRLGRPRSNVYRQRVALHIPPFIPRPPFKEWTRAEEKLLGKLRDEEIARRFRRTLESVKVHRGKLGLTKPDSRHRRWHPEEDRLLGKFPDAEVARRTGHPIGSVSVRRNQLGLRDPSKQPPFGHRTKTGCWARCRIKSSPNVSTAH